MSIIDNIYNEHLNELSRKNQQNKPFTADDINLDIISKIQYIQKLPIRYRTDVIQAIISNMLGSGKLFLNGRPQEIHDSLGKQCFFWTQPSKIWLANEISSILKSNKFKYHIDDLKQSYKYDEFSYLDKKFLDINMKTIPYIYGYERYNINRKNILFSYSGACSEFDKNKEIFLESIFTAMVTFAADGMAPGRASDIENVRRSKDIRALLMGKRPINDIGMILLKDTVDKKSGR